MNKLGRQLIKAVQEDVLVFLKAQEPAYVVDGVGDSLSRIFTNLNRRFGGTIIASFAQTTSSNMLNAVVDRNRKKFDRSLHAATGINIGEVVAAEGIEDFVSLQISKNVSLIRSIPQEYLKQVETIVNNGVINGSRSSTIAKEIAGTQKSVNRKLANRIATIARNEVQTINAQITLRRSDSLGIKEGIFRTSEDERVRKCHAELNGIRFKLNKGAWSKTCQKFIIPGVTDINCRCSFSPVIEV